MAGNAKNTTATVITTLRYLDAPAAIEFLCAAFGFERHLVVPGENGTIAHAQLTFGNGMIMLGSAREAEHDVRVKPARTAGGTLTSSPYIIVDDCDAHCARAKAAGAEITMVPEDQDHGGRLYSCLDPEGQLWNFGTYDPWDASHDGAGS